jgi:hypothetical protein
MLNTILNLLMAVTPLKVQPLMGLAKLIGQVTGVRQWLNHD